MALKKNSERFEDAKVFNTIDPKYEKWCIEDQKYYLEKQASLLELALSVSKFYEYRVKFDREGQQNRFTRSGDKSSVKV